MELEVADGSTSFEFNGIDFNSTGTLRWIDANMKDARLFWQRYADQLPLGSSRPVEVGDLMRCKAILFGTPGDTGLPLSRCFRPHSQGYNHRPSQVEIRVRDKRSRIVRRACIGS